MAEGAACSALPWELQKACKENLRWASFGEGKCRNAWKLPNLLRTSLNGEEGVWTLEEESNDTTDRRTRTNDESMHR